MYVTMYARIFEETKGCVLLDGYRKLVTIKGSRMVT